MLLKKLMKKEFVESPEKWMEELDDYFIVEEYEWQLKRDVEFAVSWIDWSDEHTVKQCIDALGWKYINHHHVGNQGVVSVEAYFEPDKDSMFKLKCSAVCSVRTVDDEVVESLIGPVMLHFPNGEQREMFDVSCDCQDDFALLKECIDIGGIDVLSSYKPTTNCLKRVNQYRFPNRI